MIYCFILQYRKTVFKETLIFFNLKQLLISNSQVVSKPKLFAIIGQHMVTIEVDHKKISQIKCTQERCLASEGT